MSNLAVFFKKLGIKKFNFPIFLQIVIVSKRIQIFMITKQVKITKYINDYLKCEFEHFNI